MKPGISTGFLLLAAIWLLNARKAYCASDYSMNKDCLKAYELLLQLKTEEAANILKAGDKTNPGNNIIVYLENYIDFLEIIISEEEEVFNERLLRRKSRLALLGEGNKRSPWHLYCQAQFNMQWAFARIKHGQYTTAALELNRSYRQLNENKKLFPGFKPNDAALALLHVLIGSVPDNYKWVTGVLAFEGTVDQGTSELKQLLGNPATLVQYPFLRAEGLFLLSFITFNFSASQDDSGFLLHMIENQDNRKCIATSPLLIYAASAYYLHNGMNEKALKLLMNRPKGPGYFPFHYLEYLTGVALLNKTDVSARIHFLRFVTSFRGKNFIKSAYQRLAWIELLMNNPEGYRLYIHRILLRGADEMDGDKQALAEARLSAPPNVSLLKARLLSDGGYYKEALQILGNPSESLTWSIYERLEYTYRLGRIYHKSGFPAKAIGHYEETLKLGADAPHYFAANAALQLGIIHEASGNKERARHYYELCLSLRYDEYRTSISQKASAGLSRVKQY